MHPHAMWLACIRKLPAPYLNFGTNERRAVGPARSRFGPYNQPYTSAPSTSYSSATNQTAKKIAPSSEHGWVEPLAVRTNPTPHRIWN